MSHAIFDTYLHLKINPWEFPGDLVVRIRAFTAGARVQSLVGELRSLKLCSVAKKKKKNYSLCI